MLYVYTNHNVTNAVKLRDKLVLAGDLEPEFLINGDLYIESPLTQSEVDAVVEASSD